MKQPILNLFLLCIALLIVNSCSMMGTKKAESIVGTWHGKSPQEVDIILFFREDMSMTTLMKSSQGDFTIEAKYSIDYEKKPIMVDIYDMNFPQGEGAVYLGIAEFKDNTTMLFHGVVQQSGATENRPSTFGDDTVEYKKVKNILIKPE